MPKKGKGKGDTAVAPLPPIDQAYVQALKIQHLEDRNEALRGELQTLRHERELLKSDETDVHEHMQRDIRSKGVRIGELQRELQETRAQLEEAVSSKEQELAKQREEIEAERLRTATEMQRTSNELHEVKAFQERRTMLEAELVELRKQVDELKTRHEVEVGDLKREFDLKYADVHTKCNAKVEEMERSVEARAMQRVDAVTKKTIVTNTRQTREIENLHKEVDELRRKMDRMLQENQALRFEVDVKGNALGESQDRIAALKGEVSKLSKAAAEREREERNRQQSSDRDDKQTLVLQMMVRSLEDRLAKQARQIAHYQKNHANTKQGASVSKKDAVNPAGATNSSVYNFVGAFGTSTLEQSGGEKLSTLSDWFAPMEEGSTGAHRRAKTTGNNSTMIRTSVQGRVTAPGGAMKMPDGGGLGGGKRGLKMPALKGMQVSKDDVARLLLAATDQEIAQSLEALTHEGKAGRSEAPNAGRQRGVTHSGAVTYR